jgi:hypothetical protein
VRSHWGKICAARCSRSWQVVMPSVYSKEPCSPADSKGFYASNAYKAAPRAPVI